MTQRIAIIGGGIAGLCAAWVLKKDHEVTLFERHNTLGMDAFSIDLPTRTGVQRIDVPMRVVYEAYYPNLTSLYRQVGIELEPLEYSGSFTRLDDQTYFSYRNLRLGTHAFPMLSEWRSMLRPETVHIAADALRFFATVARDLRCGKAEGLTLEEYLQTRNLSAVFVEGFLLPALAGICTCTYDAVRGAPAVVVLDYFARGLFNVPVKRVRHGTQDVVTRLSAGVQHVRLGAAVDTVTATKGVATVRVGGVDQHFDHVVIAAQANHALRMLQCTPQERNVLSSFTYQPSTVLMHSDTRLAPPNRAQWRPVNFILTTSAEMPMATIWMNAVHSNLGSKDVFQTWNPVIEPDPARVFSRVAVERPVINEASVNGIAKLEALHAMPDRRIWFAGAYASRGVPLLESAATSGLAVAKRISGQSAMSSVS
jgi:predicted NAD/FAD-binding protein